ncbi:MAG: hypothetical protein QOE08_23 [Thermoleophilaceae bacterium]|nr:hypothetical protein [Thermoleophilaceae bacterium]
MVTDTYKDSAPEEEQRKSPGPEVAAIDYAALNAVFGALFAAAVIAARQTDNAKSDPITGAELIPISAATFALAKVIAREKIGSWMREPFVDHTPDGERRPRGRRLQRAVGELVTCTRCVGAWSALGIVGQRMTSPQTGRMVTNVLAASAANDWMQASFKYVTAAANRADRG